MRHFGRHGYRGASLRGILADADANGAAANYHFGSKAGLYEATICRYFDRTRARRKSLLDEAEQPPSAGNVSKHSQGPTYALISN